ncbi:S-4TM family putative pore-forming effector [Streptomyces sp. NPDC002742]|uniref:S-4TM family putative pore-forming effector n=1 Tax=Streptomyces sp. NPDC002742 TaxID=3364663 RepID=UPI00367565B3
MTEQPPTPAPRAPNRIAERQNQTRALDLLDTYSRRYRTAARWRRLRGIGTYALALLTPLLVLAWPGQSALIGSLAAAWLVIGRTVFTYIEQSYSTRAADIQEALDTDLFGLPWNAAVAGRPDRVREDIAEAAPYRHRPQYQDWYNTDDTTPWPADVLLCQLQNVAWGRRNHRAYLPCLIAGGTVLVLFDLAWAIARNMSVYDFLIMLFLPTAPALLDLGDLILSHLKHSGAKGRIEDNIRELLQRLTDGEDLDPDECRRVQDAIYQLRCTGPRIPGWFYRYHRTTDHTVHGASIDDLRRQTTAPAPS